MAEKQSASRTAFLPSDYLAKPYQRCVTPDADGTYRAEIVEFPGCIATGESGTAALEALESVAAAWLEATLASGLRVPEPIENAGFSGKLVLRLAKTLHRKAAQAAARDGVSLNQFIATSVAESVGERSRSRSLDSGAVVLQVFPGNNVSYASAIPQIYNAPSLLSPLRLDPRDAFDLPKIEEA